MSKPSTWTDREAEAFNQGYAKALNEENMFLENTYEKLLVLNNHNEVDIEFIRDKIRMNKQEIAKLAKESK